MNISESILIMYKEYTVTARAQLNTGQVYYQHIYHTWYSFVDVHLAINRECQRNSYLLWKVADIHTSYNGQTNNKNRFTFFAK